ncbi:MAG: NADH:flavin oxidoreductase [Terriglobia bacterium]
MPGLLDPLESLRIRLKNRLVLAPMAMNKATPNGQVTGAVLDHYRRRAVGPGLVIVEHAYVERNGRLSPQQLGVHEDGMQSGLAKLANVIRTAGAASALQISHCGSRTEPDAVADPVAPSAIAFFGEHTPHELSKTEILGLPRLFAKAARRAKEAGFDAVEIHGAHGFLLNQFHSPLTNRRTDAFGGSFGNRIRLTKELLGAVRTAVGDDYPVLFRLGADDRVEKGLDAAAGAEIARAIAPYIDIIDVSGGLCGSRPADLNDRPGYFVPLAEKIRAAVSRPVIGVGGIRTPELANDLVAEDRLDLVAVGRAILKDPDWGSRAIEDLESAG